MIDPDQASNYLNADHPDNASPTREFPAGTKTIAVGITNVTNAVIRVELALQADPGVQSSYQWFDAGSTLDLDDTTMTRAVDVTGYVAIRLAVRTAAAELIGIWWGPTHERRLTWQQRFGSAVRARRPRWTRSPSAAPSRATTCSRSR